MSRNRACPSVRPELAEAMRRAVTAGLTQKEIAVATGLCTATVSKYVAGLTPAHVVKREEMAMRRIALAGLGADGPRIARLEGCSRQAVYASIRRFEARRKLAVRLLSRREPALRESAP